ncbi:MAG TPA: very short patch repair endonuclease [Alphaproteobacteria bacterium]|jgi:DNA mismatch endonuclease (patch repair protein)
MTAVAPDRLAEAKPSYAKPSPERSAIMRAIKGKDTKPELAVRSLLHRMGYRFRLHSKTLPGRPDLFLRRHSLAIFVHGCFWHRHANCKLASDPKSNVAYWQEKFSRNRRRDRAARTALTKAGIKSLVLWECEIRKGDAATAAKLRAVLGDAAR